MCPSWKAPACCMKTRRKWVNERDQRDVNDGTATQTDPGILHRAHPRSQTPFGNALVGETLFRMEGVSGSPAHLPPLVPSASLAGGSVAPPADTPAWGTEFPSQMRSQTEFGNEGGGECVVHAAVSTA